MKLSQVVYASCNLLKSSHQTDINECSGHGVVVGKANVSRSAAAAALPGTGEEERRRDALAAAPSSPCPGPVDAEEDPPIGERLAEPVDLGEQG